MKFSIEAKFLVLLLVCGFLAVFFTQYWHSAPAVISGNTGIALIEYPQKAYADENACFTMEFLFSSNNLQTSVHVEAKSSQILVSETEAVKQGKNSMQKTYCFSSEKLEDGNNLVEITAVSTNIFFHVKKESFARPLTQEPVLEINSIEKDTINFSVSGFDAGRIEPIQIFVNGKLDHRVFPKKKEQAFSEKISLAQGANNIEIRLGSVSKTENTQFLGQNSMPIFLGIPLLIIAFAVFAFFVFSRHNFFEKFALSFASVFALAILLGFIFGYLKLLNIFSFLFSFIAVLLILAFYFRKNFSQSFESLNFRHANIIFVLAILFFFTVPLFFQFFTSTHITYWNGFYERSSAAISQNFEIPTEDSLSYFGRGFSAVPGYFFLNAGISWITGLSSVHIYALLLLLSGVFFFLAGMFFASSLNLSKNKSALFMLFICLEGFFVSAIGYSPRHVLAFGFFLLGLALLIKHKNWVISSFFLGIMAFIQAPLLVFFPVFYLIVSPKIEWKKLVKTIIGAGIIFGILFLPNILQYGMLSQAQSQEWGYLINYSPYYLFIDIVALLVFFVLFFAPEFARKTLPLTSHNKKLLLGFAFGLILQLTVIYRWNILTTVNLALLIAIFFPDKSLLDRVAARLLAIILLISFGFMLYSMTFVNVHELVLQPMDFLKENSSTNSRILSDPMYGHSVAFIAQRPVLADLQVEYADEQKLLDAYAFLEEKDYGVIPKYDIDYTVNQVDFVHRRAIGEQRVYGIIEFKKFDKIFSNGFIFIHRAKQLD